MSDQPIIPKEHDETSVPPLKQVVAEKSGALDSADSVQAAGTRMRETQATVWPVTEEQKLVGVVDQQNPDWELGGHGHDPKEWTVGQIMSRELVFCYEDQDCLAARKLMEEKDLRYLPVVDRQMRIVGIFSREEIAEKTRTPAVAH